MHPMQVLFDIILFYKFVPRVLLHHSQPIQLLLKLNDVIRVFYVKVLLYNYFYITSDIADI